MKKVRILQVLFDVLALVALVLLTGEIFGQMRPLFLKLFVITAWSSMVLALICAMVYSVQKRKNKEN